MDVRVSQSDGTVCVSVSSSHTLHLIRAPFIRCAAANANGSKLSEHGSKCHGRKDFFVKIFTVEESGDKTTFEEEHNICFISLSATDFVGGGAAVEA